MPLPARQERFTFADYLTWYEDEHIEIIDSKAFVMVPPARVHQEISGMTSL